MKAIAAEHRGNPTVDISLILDTEGDRERLILWARDHKSAIVGGETTALIAQAILKAVGESRRVGRGGAA